VLINNGGNSLKPYVGYHDTSTNTPFTVAAADFNNDGRPDLAAADPYSGVVSIQINRGDRTFAAADNFPVGNSP
jgi:hypothetical protein